MNNVTSNEIATADNWRNLVDMHELALADRDAAPALFDGDHAEWVDADGALDFARHQLLRAPAPDAAALRMKIAILCDPENLSSGWPNDVFAALKADADRILPA